MRADTMAVRDNPGGRTRHQCPAVDGSNATTMYGGAVVKKEIKTEEGSQAHYTPCPGDSYTQQIRYTVDYRVQRRSLRSHHPTPSVSRIAMSLDSDSLLLHEASPLNPLDLSNENASYYSATAGDLASFYDFPPQGPLDGGSPEMYGGSCDGLSSPTYSKMVDPRGSTCELLSLEELSNSSLGCDDYISSGIGNSLDSLDQDWLIEPVSLPSPEEQDGDIKFTSLSPLPPQTLQFTTYQYPSVPVESSSPSLLTPDPSLPSTPLSIHSYSSEEEEIKDVLACFDDGGLIGTPPFTSANIMLPLQQQQRMVDISPSPAPSSSSVVWTSTSTPSSPRGGEGDTEGVRGMLGREESSSSLDVRRSSSASLPSVVSVELSSGGIGNGSTGDKSRKRKSLPILPSDKQTCAPTPAAKRRLSKVSKKERKREQNKTAALRYRQKKKEEKSDIEVRRAELEDRNSELKAQVNSLSNEINYLKKLWSEVCEKRTQQHSGSSS